jgi:hypothetical protein
LCRVTVLRASTKAAVFTTPNSACFEIHSLDRIGGHETLVDSSSLSRPATHSDVRRDLARSFARVLVFLQQTPYTFGAVSGALQIRVFRLPSTTSALSVGESPVVVPRSVNACWTSRGRVGLPPSDVNGPSVSVTIRSSVGRRPMLVRDRSSASDC